MTDRPFGKREAPFSLRLSFEEKAKLKQQAGGMPLASYIKSLVFAADAPKYRKRRQAAEADEKLLAEVLAALGASRIGNNLNQLAKSANSGTLYFDDETKADIKRACEDVRAMRVLLMRALGLQDSNKPRPPESTSQSFARAANTKTTLPPKSRFTL
ncbi:MobC family plasmid mobilization relaxosome protein [Rhodovulum sulfidophilum]|uniref:plasmid mobilization relaxosome protein MobC n=1 Tax=Rhodovulum sulfidophilum TaxID=35806 RepID=UPI001F16ED7A|nr:plasmid mobilization relaxosome protein MobC [Rhodovulum sulfidophilum]MCE8431416.1 MobC family plasmid mobilization relaxosome protein [Rhodovulum sulfidophilum]MCF4118597.1 MobC family plasmid mobilization relaxosome protein [Rhodovulum sulfidophilum]